MHKKCNEVLAFCFDIVFNLLGPGEQDVGRFNNIELADFDY